MSQSLTWGLVIATYNREKILPTAIQYAVEQTRKPSEIVIVDASEHWETTRDRIAEIVLDSHCEIRLIYLKAEMKSASCQRNQGLKSATADVVFMIDDDTFLYPDCAEKIMQVYEADPYGYIKGVQPALDLSPPSDISINDSKKAVVVSREEVEKFNRLGRWIWKNIFLMDHKMMWIPYQGDYPRHEVPPAVLQQNIEQVDTLHGCRMTFRREVICEEQFEPLLLSWSAGEDMDTTHRIAHRGALVEVLDAKAHHFHSGSGRISRYHATLLQVLNQALFLKRNAGDLAQARASFFRLMLRRIPAEFFKDSLSQRWTLPQMRGILAALRYAPSIFDSSLDELEQHYPQLQQKLLQQN